VNPITTVRLQSTSSADQAQVPFTFGQVFKAGDLAPTDGLAAGDLTLQVDVKALHADGSVRHAIISSVYPKLKAGETSSLPLIKAKPIGGAVGDLSAIAGTDAKVTIAIGGEAYSASLAGADVASITTWLAGPAVVEGFVNAPLKNAQGVEHPLLQVRFGVRYYPAIKQARVEVIVENCKTWVSSHKFTYDAEFTVGGKVAYSAKGLTHYHHSRWHQYAWTGTAPQVHIMHDTAYLISTKAVSNYDTSLPPSPGVLVNMGRMLSANNTGPMKIGTMTADMGMSGGRGDIGPLPDWSVNYVLSMDKRAKDVLLANADGSGSLPIHYRDENTGAPIRTDNEKNALISLHQNLADHGPLPVPRYASKDDEAAVANVDLAHFPSLAYLPYLVTGELYYLEELQFLASFSPIGTDPAYNGNGKGLLRWHQLRGQAWTMRTLAEAAAITPDNDPMKGYFLQQLDNNLEFYNKTYVVGNPNALGVYDGSGEGSFTVGSGVAPWQDDFFTWMTGYVADLGFDKALPLAQWKGKFPVGRMVGEGYCWIMAAPYSIPFVRDKEGKIVKTFGDLYQNNFAVDQIPTDGWELKNQPAGASFKSMACGSQEQANYLAAINRMDHWDVGRMVGLSDSTLGYPANMQPALAAAVDAGVPDAEKAWTRFQSRAIKPDYSQNPQWNIIPRSMSQPVAVPYTPPVVLPSVPDPLPMLTIGQKPKDGVEGTWAKIGDENGRIKAAAGTFVRYGVPGKAYRYAQVIGDFVATNDAFGGDPVPQVVKVVEAFTVAPPKKPGKIKTGANKKLAKLKGLQVTVIDPITLNEVKVLDGVTASSTGMLTLSDAAITTGAVYALKAADAKGNILDIMYPFTATK
jgi:hypothetical protein